VPRQREEVFAFFADAFQLEAITPPWLNFRVFAPGPIEMKAGQLIDYRLRLRGWPIAWRTLISEWEPTRRFVDEQVRGPYRFWRHEHVFTEFESGTLVEDTVDYAVPGGGLAHWLVVRGDLLRIFQFRGRTLRRIFGASDGAPIPFQ
jgi:ligand-binding SRPBCC domain-containing protein